MAKKPETSTDLSRDWRALEATIISLGFLALLTYVLTRPAVIDWMSRGLTPVLFGTP